MIFITICKNLIFSHFFFWSSHNTSNKVRSVGWMELFFRSVLYAKIIICFFFFWHKVFFVQARTMFDWSQNAFQAIDGARHAIWGSYIIIITTWSKINMHVPEAEVLKFFLNLGLQTIFFKARLNKNCNRLVIAFNWMSSIVPVYQLILIISLFIQQRTWFT